MANVNEISDHNKINVVTNVENNVTVTQPNIQTVEVLAGPRGQQGPTGPPGTGAVGGFTGSFSGSFLGDGSELNNIPASAIVGLNLSQIASGSVTASISPGGGFFVNTNITASGNISASSGIVTALTGSFNHIITDSETIEFRSKELGSRIGQLKFNSTNGLEVQDQLGARAKIRAARGEFLSLEAGPVGMNSLGPITGSDILVNNNLIVLGTGSFTHFITTYESASIIYASGSTKFGDTMDDTHVRTGSMSITGSLVVTGGTLTGDGSGLTNVFEGTVASQSISTRLTTQETKTIFSGSFSGSYQGDGSGLTNVPASGVVGLNLSQIASGTATASISPINGFDVNTNITASGTISIQTASPLISLKRTNNVNNSSIDFIGQSGFIGSKIQFIGNSNDLTFGTYNGSSVVERLRLEDGTDGKIKVIGDTQITGSLENTGDILLKGGLLSIKNQGAQSEARFYCEVSNAHYTALKAQPHSLYSGNPTTLLPAYDFDFAKPKFQGDTQITGSLTVSGSTTSNIILPDAPPNALVISGSTTPTRLLIHNPTLNNNPAYTKGAGIKIESGVSAGSQATLEIAAHGSANGGGNNEQTFIHSNQQITIQGAGSAAGYNVRLEGTSGYGGYLSAGTGLTRFRLYGNGGSTPISVQLGHGSNYVDLKTTGNANQLIIGRNNTDTWVDVTSTRTIFAGDISGSTTSTASFGTYIGDGSGLTGLGGAYGISNSNGVYTYYATLSASIAAASAGDVVEVFADVVETNPVTILFKDGVNINGNGHTYTLDHSSSMAAFADYEAQETSGTSISCSIHNFNMRRINGDDSSVEFASTIYIHNDTAGADTFLDLRGSTIFSDNGYTYFCSYRHGRVQGGRFIGDRDGGAFQLNAPTNTHYPSLYDAVCDFSIGYAQVGSATNCTFISKGGIYGLQTVTGGDYKISNCSIYAQAVGRGSGAVQGVRIGNTATRFEDCYVSVGGTNNYGVYGATTMRGCTIESSGIGVFASGAGQNISNNRIHSTGNAAASLRTGYSSGTYIYANNTFTSDATSYPTVYYRGETDTDGTFNNNSIYAEGNNANAHALQITVQAGHDCHIYNNTLKVFNPGANCIYANGQDIAFLAGNIYETATVAVHPNVTQSFTNVPDEQGNIHITSSLNNDRIYSGSFSGSFVGDGSLLTGVEAFPFSGTAQITGSLSLSGSIVDFSNASSVVLPATTVPLINPKVEYFTTTAITSSGTTVSLPGDLTFISSSTFEYLEIFINGLRLRYDIDFAPQSTGSVKYFVSLPVGTEVTYKSLNRP